MGNKPSSHHPKTDLYPYMGYGVVASPGFNERAFFDDIINQPLVKATEPRQQRRQNTRDRRRNATRKGWESSSLSSRTSRKFSLDSAYGSAVDTWQRFKPRRAVDYEKMGG